MTIPARSTDNPAPSEIEFDTPPSRDLEFETPKARLWEHWVEALRDNPRQWAKLPYRKAGSKASVKASLKGIPGVELVDEGEELYARYDPSRDSTLVASSPNNQAYPPLQPMAPVAPLPHATGAADAASRIQKISGIPGGIMAPATTPLSGGRDGLLENPPGPIIGE